MAKRNRGRRLIRRGDVRTARAEANVRYGPERSALTTLLGEAQGQFKQEVRAAKDAAKFSRRSAAKARAPLAAVYNQALTRSDVAQGDVNAAFGRLGAAADPFEAATARESALNRQQIADAAARANKELTDRQGEAAIGRQFAVGAARQRYETEKSTIAKQLLGLQRQKGQYMAGRLGTLAEKRMDIRATERAAAKARRGDLAEIQAEERGDIRKTRLEASLKAKTDNQGLYTSGDFSGYSKSSVAKMSEAERVRIANKGGGGGAGGGEGASTSERRMFSTEFARAFDVAKGYANRREPRAKVARNLRAGIPGSTKQGTVTVSAVKDQIAMRAALDMAYLGYVRDSTAKQMRSVGHTVANTPRAITHTQWLKRKPGLAGRPVGTTGKAPF